MPKGVLGLEIDQGMVPQAFRDMVTEKTRIAAFRHWIVRLRPRRLPHGDPLAAGACHGHRWTGAHKPAASEMTSLQLWSRTYTVSQKCGDGNFAQHLLAEVVKVETMCKSVII
jgi:hypothetical protein